MTAESSEGSEVVDLIDALEALLVGPTRSHIVSSVSAGGELVDWRKRLRTAMEAHAFPTESGVVELGRLVRRLDGRTREDGFRVLHAWNHQTHTFTDDIVPVLMLDFLERARASSNADSQISLDRDRVTLAIMLDYYLLHLLALCAMRAWDTREPGETLDRITALVRVLQGEDGSGHHFVDDAETLLIYALSQFHPEEQAYDRIIDKVILLSDAHQMAFASVSASVLSAHLRWGFWLMYDRDPVRMRRDNVGDYPWLLNSVLTLLRGYVRSIEAAEAPAERAGVTQALLQGLAADPWAFTGSPPPALAEFDAEYAELISLLEQHLPTLLDELELQKPDKKVYEQHLPTLLDELELQKPDKKVYAPLALHFNFPHNTLVAIVTLALLEGRPQTLSLNQLFVPEIEDLREETQEGLARTLMAFSRGSPDRLGYRGAMLVAYDPLSGLRSFSMTTDTLRRGFQ